MCHSSRPLCNLKILNFTCETKKAQRKIFKFDLTLTKNITVSWPFRVLALITFIVVSSLVVMMHDGVEMNASCDENVPDVLFPHI